MQPLVLGWCQQVQPAQQLLPLGLARAGAASNPRGNKEAKRDALGNEEHASSVAVVTTWFGLASGSGLG